jgi:hypothetical protein
MGYCALIILGQHYVRIRKPKLMDKPAIAGHGVE